MKTRYTKHLTLAAASLMLAGTSFAQLDSTLNGVSDHHIQDDFQSADPYESLDTTNKWINWYSEDTTIYQLSRPGNGELVISCFVAAPGYQRVIVSFGEDSLGNPLTIDLSQNAELSFGIKNTSPDSATTINVGLVDINDNTIDVQNDTTDANAWNGKVHAEIANLLGGDSLDYSFDLTNGYAIDPTENFGWTCSNGTVDCPTIKPGDMTQIKMISFAISPGGGTPDKTYPTYSGDIILSNLKVGGEPKADPTLSTTENTGLNGSLSMFPNPMESGATIKLQVKESMMTSIVLFNALGQSVQTIANETLTTGTHLFQIERNNLEEGVYFLQVVNALETNTQKILMK